LILAALIPAPGFAQEETAAEPAARPGPTQQPRAAMIAPLASKTRLLSLAGTGKRVVAVGQQGVIVASDDGVQWRQVPSPVSQMLNRVRFIDDKTGWIAGYDSTLLKTEDGGASWSLKNFNPAGRPLFDVLALDASRLIAVGGYGTLLQSGDGGNTWAAASSPITDLGLHFNTVLRLGDGSLFIAGEKGLMARSSDEGANWQMLQSPYVGSFFGALPLGDKGVLVYGMRGNVFISRDVTACPTREAAGWDEYAAESVTDSAKIAALGWRQLSNPVRESLFGGSRLPGGEYLLVGVNGTALKTAVDAGTLTVVNTPADETLADVLGMGSRVIAVGRRGVQQLGEIR
jgi:photosystem II stability/assembly factor-like uncharacterized protein